jgi:hypothetical protein
MTSSVMCALRMCSITSISSPPPCYTHTDPTVLFIWSQVPVPQYTHACILICVYMYTAHVYSTYTLLVVSLEGKKETISYY